MGVLWLAKVRSLPEPPSLRSKLKVMATAFGRWGAIEPHLTRRVHSIDVSIGELYPEEVQVRALLQWSRWLHQRQTTG